MPFLDKLNTFDFRLKRTYLELLGLNLTLISPKALRVVTHLLLYLIKLLHVVIDLLSEVLHPVVHTDEHLLLRLSLFHGLGHCTLDCGLEFLFDFGYDLGVSIHLLAVASLLHTVIINRLLDLRAKLSVLIDLSLPLNFLLIQLNLNFFHLFVEIGS